MARILIVVLAMVLGGCASLTSTPVDDLTGGVDDAHEGLLYYLPKRDLKVTITIDANGKFTAVAAEATSAYPDVNHAFRLDYNRSWLGTNDMKIEVSTKGLLTKANSKLEYTDIAKAFGALAGAHDGINAHSLVPGAVKPCGEGTHVFVYPLPDVIGTAEAPCQLALTVTRWWKQPTQAGTATDPNTAASFTVPGGSYSGLYYRSSRPYLVTLAGAINRAQIVFSPNEGRYERIPYSRTMFANGTMSSQFTDGELTHYDQKTDGELLAAMKLPAAIIGAYFEAMGKVFTSFKTQDTAEIDRLKSEYAAAVAEKKYKACLEAVKSDASDDVIAGLGCNEP